MPRATVPLPDARTRIDASTVPMHGCGADRECAAEQRVRPAAPGVLQQAGRHRALRPRQQPDEREPDHDQHEAGDLDLRLLVDRAADRGGAGAEQHEDGREAEDERDARDHDPPADAALAEPVDLDGGDRREIARQQRQHARRDHRHETREERDRQLLSHRSARAPRRPDARPRGRARPAPAHEARRAFSTTHAPRAPARSAAASAPPSGITHASRSKPLVLGVERIVGPNSSTIASRICRSDWHAAMRCFTSDFISRATSESDSSSVV